ncbi:helix-turn-helix domain-containing protein [Marasmitruncus massiliensis]|uniref:helix-turn-helix domain-containing protein n=1 Tax=Marasmitruncus massiliensis TaxID=1944642 RepID=UPI000C7A4174|nr:helix-turn-helix transcriptional regulator [Marasmitruncus massiliensis]MBE6905023.1 helix-turn-helix transcriptional regulator [Oscillospiraceae bacterium]
MSIGQQIKNIRQERHLSQKQLAQMAQISPSYLCDVEKGRCNCSIKILKRISLALNVEIAELLK